MTEQIQTPSPIKNATGLKKLWTWMKAIDESFNYDPVEELIKSKIDLNNQISQLEARILDLETPRIEFNKLPKREAA